MPMGGLGSRFSNEGYLMPKPLIDVGGIPMYQQALSSFDAIKSSVSFFAVVRAEHEEQFGLGTILESSGVNVTIFEGNTRGAAETALLGTELLAGGSPLAVVDCDIRFSCPNLLQDLLRDPPPFSAAITYFESSDPRYSYAEIDSAGNVIRTAEKKPISNRAIIGCYAFADASSFEKATSQEIRKGPPTENSEYYMSQVLNAVIGNGGIVRSYPGSVDSFGTPEELKTFFQSGVSQKREKDNYRKA